MEAKKTDFGMGQIAGLVLALAAALRLLNVLRIVRYYFSFSGLLLAAAFGFAAAVLLMKRRDKLLLIALGALAAVLLFWGGMVYFVAAALLLVMALTMTTEYLPQAKALMAKIWFLPAAFVALDLLIWVISAIFGRGGLSFSGLLIALLTVGGFALSALWLVWPEGAPANLFGSVSAAPVQENGTVTVAAPAVDGWCELFKHTLLLLLTFGIWNLIWIYRMTRYLNRVGGEAERKPVNQLLLCLFVPFYAVYWTYKSAQRVDKLSAAVGVESRMATLALILAACLPIVAPIVLQSRVNTVIDVESGTRRRDFDPAEKPVMQQRLPLAAVEGYCDMFKHLLLLLITFGVWYFIWIYRTTRYLNRVAGEEHRNPTTKLLLCMFVPFYAVYWNYKSAQRVDKLALETGVKSDLAVLCLVLSLVGGILPQLLLQDKINEIAAAENSVPAPVLEAAVEV